MNSVTDLSLDQALDLALQAELKAEEFYAKAAAASGDARGKEMFAQLAQFEHSHYEHVLRLRKKLLGDGEYSGYPGQELLPGQPISPASHLTDNQRQTDLDALSLAIEAETKAYNLYTAMLEKTTDASVQVVLKRLAHEEEIHRRVLEDQFLALTNSGHWTWGE